VHIVPGLMRGGFQTEEGRALGRQLSDEGHLRLPMRTLLAQCEFLYGTPAEGFAVRHAAAVLAHNNHVMAEAAVAPPVYDCPTGGLPTEVSMIAVQLNAFSAAKMPALLAFNADVEARTAAAIAARQPGAPAPAPHPAQVRYDCPGGGAPTAQSMIAVQRDAFSAAKMPALLAFNAGIDARLAAAIAVRQVASAPAGAGAGV